MDPSESVRLKLRSADTVLQYQFCPHCKYKSYLYDSEIAVFSYTDQKGGIKIKIGNKEIILYPSYGITEVRWIDQKFIVGKLAANEENWRHECQKAQEAAAEVLQ